MSVVCSPTLEAPAQRSARSPKITALIIILVVSVIASLVYHELRTSAIQSWLLSRYAATPLVRDQARAEPQHRLPARRAIRRPARLPAPRRFQPTARSPPATRWPSRRARARGWSASSAGASHRRIASRRRRDWSSTTSGATRSTTPDRATCSSPTSTDVPPLIVKTLLFLENRELDEPDRSRQQSRHRLATPRQGRRPLRGARGSGCPSAPRAAARSPSSSRSTVTRRAAAPPRRSTSCASSPRRASGRTATAPTARRAGGRSCSTTSTRCRWPPRRATARCTASGTGFAPGSISIWSTCRDALAAPGTAPRGRMPTSTCWPCSTRYAPPPATWWRTPALLEKKIDAYGDLLLKAGVIDRDLNRALRDVPLRFGGRVDQPPIDFAERRASTTIREDVRRLLVCAASTRWTAWTISGREHHRRLAAGHGHPPLPPARRQGLRRRPRPPRRAPAPDRRSAARRLQSPALRADAVRQPAARPGRQPRPALRHQLGDEARPGQHGQAPDPRRTTSS